VPSVMLIIMTFMLFVSCTRLSADK
jgi:hypothetical protein